MERLTDIAGRVWAGEIRGIVYAVVDNKRSIYPRWYLLNTPDCPFDYHMPSAMATRLAHSIEREAETRPPKVDDPE